MLNNGCGHLTSNCVSRSNWEHPARKRTAEWFQQVASEFPRQPVFEVNIHIVGGPNLMGLGPT